MMSERAKRREQRLRDEIARLHEVQDRNESRLRKAIANVITRANDYDVAFSLMLEEEQIGDTPTREQVQAAQRLGDRAAALASAVSLALVESDEELGTLLLRVRDAARVATLDRLEAEQYWQDRFGEGQVPRVASALEDLAHAMRQRKGNASLLSVPQDPDRAR